MTGSIYFLFAFLLLTANAALAQSSSEPSLLIESSTQKKEYKSSELLKRKDLEEIEVKNDPAYGRQTRKYKALQVRRLFKDFKIEGNAVILFKALDGFAAPIAKDRLLNSSPEHSVAYLAIESPQAPWPAQKPGKPSAGPFYLIWKNPELSHISKEEWPSMLTSFEIKGELYALYPQIFPQSKASSPAVNEGFQAFIKNCFACHTINKAGISKLGPDLNYPMNPTEYMNEVSLRKLIRNPKDLRYWPESRMSSFPPDVLSNKELDQLIEYLKHMAQARPG